MGARPFSPNRHDVSEGVSSDRAAEPVRLGGFAGRTREAAALVLFAAGAFVALSLLSYEADPQDPSRVGPDWAGPVGATIAGTLVRGFGVIAWLAPVALGLFGAPLFKRRSVGPIGLRIAGDLSVGIVLAALTQVAAPDLIAFGAMRGAGNVGLLFGELMRGMFSSIGSFLVGGTAIGLILIGRSSFSFIAGCQRTIQIIRAVVMRFTELVARLFGAWRDARTLRLAQRSEEQACPVPVIDEDSSGQEAILARVDEDGGVGEDDAEAVHLELPASLGQASRVDHGEVDLGARERVMRKSRAPEQSSVEDVDTGLPTATPVESADDTESVDLPVSDEDRVSASDAGFVSDAGTGPTGRGRKRARTEPVAAEGPVIVHPKPEERVARSAEGLAERTRRKSGFQLPSTDLLSPPEENVPTVDKERMLEHAQRLEKTLADYGVQGSVEEIHPGPTVTTFEFAPQAGTKVSKVASLADDLALGLSRKVRIIAPIPGKSRIGFELPNDERIPVNLRELVEDKRFAKLASKAPLPVVLGRDIVGAPFYADLASMPHVIVAGATGAGKSVGLNVMLSSLLFWRNPDELRMLMIDPKVVELAPFDGIPHMLLPVVTDMKQAAVALRWAVDEMERRYQLFANAGTKNISTYNQWVEKVQRGEVPAPSRGEVEAMTSDGAVISVAPASDGSDGVILPGKLPHIVIVVDEFADLMMQQGKEVEASVARLAQKARAAGMHVMLATQRPSVDVITGMIKANFPSRIAFRVAAKVDGRTILDEQGAEVLLGKGDMLVKLNGLGDTRRVQCPFVSEEEVAKLTDYLRSQGTPQYHEAILQAASDDGEGTDAEEAKADPRFDEAVQIVADTQRCSTSWLQRKMTIGYNRAAKIVEMMEMKGMVGPANGAKDREVYLHPQ